MKKEWRTGSHHEMPTPMRVILSWEDFHQIELIGRGRHAVVYRALWQGRPVAIKRIMTGQIKQMLHEIEIFRFPSYPSYFLYKSFFLTAGA